VVDLEEAGRYSEGTPAAGNASVSSSEGLRSEAVYLSWDVDLGWGVDLGCNVVDLEEVGRCLEGASAAGDASVLSSKGPRSEALDLDWDVDLDWDMIDPKEAGRCSKGAPATGGSLTPAPCPGLALPGWRLALRGREIPPRRALPEEFSCCLPVSAALI
jgi:hypothetical protein